MKLSEVSTCRRLSSADIVAIYHWIIACVSGTAILVAVDPALRTKLSVMISKVTLLPGV